MTRLIASLEASMQTRRQQRRASREHWQLTRAASRALTPATRAEIESLLR